MPPFAADCLHARDLRPFLWLNVRNAHTSAHPEYRPPQLKFQAEREVAVLLQLNVNDLATPTLADIWGRVAPNRRKGLMSVLGRRAERSYKKWFRDRDRTSPNAKAWPRKHFWAGVARSTVYVPSQTTDDAATVSITDPRFRIKVRGGTIRPKQAKALAVPLNAAAYEAGFPRAGRIPNLALVWAKNSSGNVLGYLGRWEAGDGVVLYYVLLRSVTVAADPQALPARAAINSELEVEADAFLRRQR